MEEEGSRSSSGNQSCSTSSSATAAASADLVGWLATGWRTAPSKSSPLSIFWDVFNYARFLNPKEFELPKDLLPAIKIPGLAILILFVLSVHYLLLELIYMNQEYFYQQEI